MYGTARNFGVAGKPICRRVWKKKKKKKYLWVLCPYRLFFFEDFCRCKLINYGINTLNLLLKWTVMFCVVLTKADKYIEIYDRGAWTVHWSD